jgi:hypothetical protein
VGCLVGGQMSKKDEYKERLKNIRWVQWQIVRRHEDYINFCDEQTFNERGALAGVTVPLKIEEAFELAENPRDPSSKIINPTIAESELSNKAKHIKKRFFLNTIFHYSKNLSKEECLDICGWRRHVLSIWPESKNFNPANLPQYGDYIYIGINITPDVKLEDIKDGVLRHVKLMRSSRKALEKQSIKDMKEKISRLQSFTPGQLIKVDDKVREILEKMEESLSETQIADLQETLKTTSIDYMIEKLQEEILDIKQGSSQTTPGKDQKLDYYKELFRVWDLHIEGKTAKEIIKEVWFDEYENEFSSKDDSMSEKLYKELRIKYEAQGKEDYDERAYIEVYGDRDENDKNMESGSGSVKFFVRVKNKIDKMEELFDMFPNT